MSTLRQVKKDVPDEPDVEAPNEKDTSAPKAAASAFAAASEGDAFAAPSGASSHNPVFIAKIIFRKVMTLLVSSDDDDLTSAGGIVTLLKDIILGVILGVITISILIFLDHRDVVHFQSAHNFRNAAFQLLNDPETVANLEEASDLKFMTIADYEAKRKEIDSVTEKISKNKEVLDKRTAEAAEKRKEVEAIKTEYDTLYNNPLLELDKWCGSCHWGMKSSCDQRAKFLQDTYNTRPIQSKISAMGHASCKGEK